MGNKVPNFLLKGLMCLCECDSVGAFVLVCVCVCVCVYVCVKLKEGCGTAPQILWRMLQKIHSVGFPCCCFFHQRTLKSFFGVLFGGRFLCRLGHTGAACRRGTHLGENLIQPLQGTIQMQLDPARSACDSLPPEKQTYISMFTWHKRKSTSCVREAKTGLLKCMLTC